MIFSFFGLVASWNIVSSLLKSQIYPDITVILLPIGLGIIKGQLWAQWWARFLILLGYIVCFLFAAMILLSPKGATAQWTIMSTENPNAKWLNQSFTGTEAALYIIVTLTVVVTILGIMHWALYSEKAKDYFFLGYVNLNRIKI